MEKYGEADIWWIKDKNQLLQSSIVNIQFRLVRVGGYL